MTNQSPPKRVTRARMAAKNSDIKIATASTKTKLTRSASATKRKILADDLHEDELQTQPGDIIEPETKSTRARAKKTTQPEPEMDEASAPAKATRGRVKKAAVEPPPPAAEPTRSTRGRTKKVDVAEEEPALIQEAPKRPTRARAAAVAKPAVPKKSVKFEEPDKENVVPTTAKDKVKVSESATGLRAKPIRKPAAAPARTTRGRAKTVVGEKVEKSSPLSPKKATQVATAKESNSDDELATSEKTPMRPLMKSPVKPPPGSAFGTAKKLDFSTSLTVSKATTSVTHDLKNSVLASPARRRPQSPFRETFKTSPQRAPLGASMLQQSPFKLSLAAPAAPAANSPFKASLLASPARRPQSPLKVTEAGSPSRSSNNASILSATPKASTFKVSRFATPRTLPKSVSRPGMMLPPVPGNDLTGSPKAIDDNTDATMTVEPSMSFSGRLSSIMPREVDPSFDRPDAIQEEDGKAEILAPVEQEDMAISDEQPNTIVVDDKMEVESITPPASPSLQSTDNFNEPSAFALRDTDESPFQDSDSEDELAWDVPDYLPIPPTGFRVSSPNFASSPKTPGPFTALPKTPETAGQRFAAARSERKESIGFTPLARQLSDWMAASPAKSKSGVSDQGQASLSDEAIVEPSPVKSTFFEDEMSVRDELADAPGPALMEPDITENFEPVDLEEGDLALAQEADEMSLLEPDEVPTPGDMFQAEELTPSEASQEYSDENAILIDPELLALPASEVPGIETAQFATPPRVLFERTFHTVCKVPLKPAVDHTPMRPSPKKRSASISRIPGQRLTNTLSRNNTVISYSPTKSTPQARSKEIATTPSKSDAIDWSTIGTPARTPRRDLNTALLKGAVIFVDVHTSEGADASVLFTELLTHMGARCVKSWAWNGNGEDGSKIGITHVIFKDGGKRTLEKVRETNGVVSCVGVGWVLDCERENQWLDESLYAVDTAMVPRGGHKRRKSMEPRALANLNGTLVSSSTTPSRKSYANMSPTKEFLSFPDTPITNKSRRRESVQWTHSPSASSPDYIDGQTLILSPVPATPAPGAISTYGEDGLYGDETPSGQTPYFLHKEQLIQKTAPVGCKFIDSEQVRGDGSLGAGFLSEKKDESVMMRLMAARRKSLQWAPKVGSPLARGELF